MWTDKEDSIKALGRFMGSGIDRETLEKSSRECHARVALSEKAIPQRRGAKNRPRRHRRTRSAGEDGQAGQFIDASFIRELDQSGFIDSSIKRNSRRAELNAKQPARRRRDSRTCKRGLKRLATRRSRQSRPSSASSKTTPIPSSCVWSKSPGADLPPVGYQVYGDGRESECERTLQRKIKDLWNLI